MAPYDAPVVEETSVPLRRRPIMWLPGADAVHDEHGPGWARPATASQSVRR